jgi:hypothetical protein
LNEEERAEFDRAVMRGFLTLTGGGNRRTRKGSPLANIHRQWCDARAKPQIILFKATNGKAIDQVVIDISPLRLNAICPNQLTVDEFMTKWKTQAITAAVENGMEIRIENLSDEFGQNGMPNSEESNYLITINEQDTEAWATKPIWQLPVLELGVFEGDRKSAKEMAKNLGNLWEIPDESFQSTTVESRGSKPIQRKRGGGHRQAW